MIKRLFVFANYDPNSVIDDATVFYVRELSELGDVIFYMDNDVNNSEIEKIKPFTVYSGAVRHGEYDFGSYKRGFIWAHDNKILNDYDFVYLVNSSMYGPFYPLEPVLEKIENSKSDSFGIVFNPHRTDPHIESWFVGMNKKVFLSDAFYSFITSVKKLENKGTVAAAYEHGFTKILINNGFTYSGLYNISGRGTYNKIKKLYRLRMPFMKKVSFTRKHGALAGQVNYILNHINPELKKYIIASESRINGNDYIKRFLTKNPVKILYRNIRHTLYKLFIEGI